VVQRASYRADGSPKYLRYLQARDVFQVSHRQHLALPWGQHFQYPRKIKPGGHAFQANILAGKHASRKEIIGCLFFVYMQKQRIAIFPPGAVCAR
jgi:hypothetical protein